MQADHLKSYSLPKGTTLQFVAHEHLAKLDFGDTNPITLKTNDRKLIAYLQQHGFIQTGSLTGGVIQILGAYLAEKNHQRFEYVRLHQSQPTNAYQTFKKYCRLFFITRPSIKPRAYKEGKIKSLIEKLQNLQAQEREIPFDKPMEQAEFTLAVYQLVQRYLTEHQANAITHHSGLGLMHRALVQAEDFISRYRFPDQASEKNHFGEQDQHGYSPQDSEDTVYTYSLQANCGQSPDKARRFLNTIHAYYFERQKTTSMSLAIAAYRDALPLRRNHILKIYTRIKKQPKYSLAAFLLSTAFAAPCFILLDPLGIHYLIANAGFTGYAADTVAVLLTLGVSLSLARWIINKIHQRYCQYKARHASSKVLTTPGSATEETSPSPTLGAHPVTHTYLNNRFRNNPIARIWHGLIVFLRWFNIHGNEYPITMTAYTSVYTVVAADLALAHPILPSALHKLAVTTTAGLISPQEGAVISALTTGFFAGKITLLASNTLQERQHCWLVKTGELIVRRPIDAAVFAGAVTVFVEVENGITLIRNTFGQWTGPDAALSTYKPLLIALDAMVNPHQSILGSTWHCLKNLVTMFRSFKELKAGLRDLEKILIEGVFTAIKFPLRYLIYPITRVVIKAITLLLARLLDALLFITPGIKHYHRHALVSGLFQLEGRYNGLAALGIRMETKWRILQNKVRWYHMLLLGAGSYFIFKYLTLYLGPQTLPIALASLAACLLMHLVQAKPQYLNTLLGLLVGSAAIGFSALTPGLWWAYMLVSMVFVGLVNSSGIHFPSYTTYAASGTGKPILHREHCAAPPGPLPAEAGITLGRGKGNSELGHMRVTEKHI